MTTQTGQAKNQWKTRQTSQRKPLLSAPWTPSKNPAPSMSSWASSTAEKSSSTATRAEIAETLDDTVIAWSGETTYDMDSGDGISFSISGPNVYVAVQAQNGSAGADVEGVTTTGWGHVHTIYRDPSNDYANSVTQQASIGMSGGGMPGGGEMPSGAPNGEMPSAAPGSEQE